MIATASAATGPARPPRTRRRSRSATPAASAREAYNRWGLGGTWERGQLVAYVSDRVVEDPVDSATLRTIDRHSPNDCEGYPNAPWMSVSWSQIYVAPPLTPTKLDPKPRPRRLRTASRLICWDCKEQLDLENRQTFRREFGYYSLEDAEIAVRVTKLDAGERREEVQLLAAQAADALYWKNRIALEAIAGIDLDYPIDRSYEQAVLLTSLRKVPLSERAALVAAAQAKLAAEASPAAADQVRADAA